MERLQKGAPTPLYHQIKIRLLEELEMGHLQPGDRVPSERELTERYGVSRMTARQALVELESEGYLVRVQGKGTFVAAPKFEQALTLVTGFTEDMRRRGLQSETRVLAAQVISAGSPVAGALSLNEGDEVYRLERLRMAGGEPLALECSHLVADRFPGLLNLDLEHHSLYELLRGAFGVHLVHATQTLEAIAADAHQAEILKLREGTPLMMTQRIARDQHGRAVEFTRSCYRGDRYRFVAELRSNEGE